MKRECRSLAAGSDADVEWGSKDHDSTEAIDKPGFRPSIRFSYQPLAAR